MDGRCDGGSVSRQKHEGVWWSWVTGGCADWVVMEWVRGQLWKMKDVACI
jgi:hypothetical protein